jgi:hypothetical protein
MGYEPHMIAPFENSGLKKWYKPWITGEKAFPSITDAYARRGVVRKREGFRILANLNGDKPVVGIKTWINPATLNENLLAFSRTKSYLFNDVTQLFNNVTVDASGAPFSWSNGPNDYFWTSNYAGSMWTTNNLTSDNIRYWNLTNNWSIYTPTVSGTTILNAGLIILPYKGRLVVLNTNESGTNYSNRARWSAISTPYVLNTPTAKPAPGFGVDPNAFRSDIPGKGGFLDADTSERIVSAAIIKDVLIVFFQRSTWRLQFTGSQIQPFIWQRLNTQFGSECPYGTVAFDEVAMTFSRYGWIAADTNDVARVDLDIPDDSFAFEAVSLGLGGLNKVQAIRDYYRNFAYFTYIPIGQTVATQIYGYNYIDKSWSIFTPQLSALPDEGGSNAINCFGAYRNTTGDFTWSTLNDPGPGPQADSWENYNSQDDTWQNFGAGQNIDFPYTLGGDLNGNVYIMFEFFQAPTSDNGKNFNFSIYTNRFNPYFQQGMKCRLGFVDLYCTSLPGGEITLNHYTDDKLDPTTTKTVELFSRGVIAISAIIPGTTTSITTVSEHGLSLGEFVTIADITGNISRILNGQTFAVTSVTSPNIFVISVNTNGFVYIANGVIYNASLVQGDAHYTRIYLGAIAHMHQIQITLSPSQVSDEVKGVAQFEMQGLVLWTRPTGKIRG